MSREIEFLEREGIPHFPDRKSAYAALLPKGGAGAEFGVMRGNNSQILLDESKPSKLYLVDPWPAKDARHNNVVARFSSDQRVVVLRKKSGEAVGDIEKLDWFDQDTSTGFWDTYCDLNEYDKKMPVGSVIFVDYCCRGGKRVHLDRYIAVRKFLMHHAHYLIIGYVDQTDSIVMKKTDIATICARRNQMYDLFPKGGVGLEIGVYLGANSLFLNQVAQPSKLYLIDCWDHNFQDYRGGAGIETGRDPYSFTNEEAANTIYELAKKNVSSIPGVEVYRGYSKDEINKIPDGSLDWVYIDGDHSYDGLTTDVSISLPKMKKKCVIAGHDWCYVAFHGVINGVIRFLKDHPDFKFVGITKERWTKSWMLVRE